MKAVRVDGFGSTDRLAVVDLPVPEPRDDEVLVRVAACGLNYADVLQREGAYLGGPRPPFVSGCEAAGTVEETGERVAVVVPSGAHAEFVVAPPSRCIELPESMEFEEAAAFPVSYLTAYHALVTCARARAGERVVVLAAAGGLGSAAVQIARCLGLSVVAVASTAAKRDFALRLGAEHAVDYAQLRDHSADVVIDPVGGKAHHVALHRLNELGRLVALGCASRDPRPVDTHGLIFRSQTVSGLHLDAVAKDERLVADALACLWPWVEGGAIEVQVGSVRPLEEIRAAHEALAGRRTMGKTVLIP